MTWEARGELGLAQNSRQVRVLALPLHRKAFLNVAGVLMAPGRDLLV